MLVSSFTIVLRIFNILSLWHHDSSSRGLRNTFSMDTLQLLTFPRTHLGNPATYNPVQTILNNRFSQPKSALMCQNLKYTEKLSKKKLDQSRIQLTIILMTLNTPSYIQLIETKRWERDRCVGLLQY